MSSNGISNLVTKIGRSGSLSRRDFIKGASIASAVGLAGCTDSPARDGDPIKIFSNVHGAQDQVPGVAVWYRSTCTECSAGCGIEVRTREGRAVKIEGNRNNPINRGGLCAIGQASLQDLYDPDRVRQPLKKVVEGTNITWKPIDWVEAYEKVATALSDKNSKKAFITGENTGALSELIADFSAAHNVNHVTYEPLSPTTVSKASELVYGNYGIPKYDFSKAEVIVNFGADFLETWVSPCEYARDWATARKSEKPLRVYHIEPRLSLTGSNADTWLNCTPGAEVQVALAVLKEVVSRGFNGGSLNDECKSLTREVDLDEVQKISGVKRSQITSMAQYLSEANGSIVLSGASAGSTRGGISLHVVTSLINVLLGNIGKTIEPALSRQPKTDIKAVTDLIADLNKGEVKLLLVDRSNPAFTLPKSLGFEYAAKNAKLVVSFSNKIDETAQIADIIMPSSTSLESWGDARPFPGVYSLIQPAMTPVFNTQSLGDMLINFALGMNLESSVGGVKNFKEYLKASWKKVHQNNSITKSFDSFWEESLENGGYFVEVKDKKSPVTSSSAYSTVRSAIASDGVDKDGAGEDSLVVYPFASIRSFDGRAANRPWLQETPDPLTQVVWDSWAEMHPETAKRYNLAQGDVATFRNKHGEINVPVYVTEYVNKNIVAIPLGQGHEHFGRYAETTSASNPFNILSSQPDAIAASFPLVSSAVSVTRSRISTELVTVDGSKSQMGREIARTKIIESADDLHEEISSHSTHEHHEPKQMYEQREHPLYKWGMTVDLNACTGCSACVVACYAENNIYTVGKELVRRGRQMAWLRIDRYFDTDESSEELTVHFMPVMCQHCGNAPCEPVCPVYATYHNEEGLNSMVYNRCVGTRYCANNCSYKVRRFNWFEYEAPEPLTWQFNPDVVTRSVGVMEKCSFCVQRITDAKDNAKDLGRTVQDGEVKPACVQSCPTEALAFGNLNDPNSKVSKLSASKRSYKVLNQDLNTQPAVSYLEDIKYRSI